MWTNERMNERTKEVNCVRQKVFAKKTFCLCENVGKKFWKFYISKFENLKPFSSHHLEYNL